MKKTTMFALALSTMMLAAACSDPPLPAEPVPVAPTILETFTGTLNIQSTNTHNFTVNQIGGVRVTLSDVEPAAAVGIGVGTPSVAGCLLASSITAVAGSSTLVSGTATVSGNFCIAVSDVGNLIEPVAYTILVTHS